MRLKFAVFLSAQSVISDPFLVVREGMTTTTLQTALTEKHEALGARMTDFAGWRMPLQYSGVREEHEAVRAHGGLFDLSHMAELVVRGGQREDFVQQMVTNDLSKLEHGQAMYSALCNAEGGIIDDLLVYRFEDEVWIVANASNRAAVWSWLQEHAEGREVALTDRTEDPTLQADGFEPLRTRLGIAYADDCLEFGFTWRRDYIQLADAQSGSSFRIYFNLKTMIIYFSNIKCLFSSFSTIYLRH